MGRWGILSSSSSCPSGATLSPEGPAEAGGADQPSGAGDRVQLADASGAGAASDHPAGAALGVAAEPGLQRPQLFSDGAVTVPEPVAIASATGGVAGSGGSADAERWGRLGKRAAEAQGASSTVQEPFTVDSGLTRGGALAEPAREPAWSARGCGLCRIPRPPALGPEPRPARDAPITPPVLPAVSIHDLFSPTREARALAMMASGCSHAEVRAYLLGQPPGPAASASSGGALGEPAPAVGHPEGPPLKPDDGPPPAAGRPLELGYVVLRVPDGMEGARGHHRCSWAGLMRRLGIPRTEWPQRKAGYYIRLYEDPESAEKLWRTQRLALPIPVDPVVSAPRTVVGGPRRE